MSFVLRLFYFSLFYGVFSSVAHGTEAAVPTQFFLDGSSTAEKIKERALLDKQHFHEVPNDQSARLFWVVGADLPNERWKNILHKVQQGAGLILVPGSRMPDVSHLGLQLVKHVEPSVSLMVQPVKNVSLTQEVVWPSAPQVGARWHLKHLSSAHFTSIVLTQGTGHPVLLLGKYGAGQIAIFSLQLTHPSNREFLLWPYFNYLLYTLATQVTESKPLSFAAWPHAPVPGNKTLGILLVSLAIAWVLTLVIYFRVRRYSQLRPEILDHFFQRATAPSPTNCDLAMTPSTPNGTPPHDNKKITSGPNWQAIGFTRPLAGFLTLTGSIFLLFAPFYYLTNILIPNHVQPFPQAKGIWDFSWEALQIAWFLFDAGTFVAFVKYFAEFRLKNPHEALRSAQFFVWWQILTGLVQVTLAGLVAVLILPHTRYGFSSNLVILIALSQYPGFFNVVTFFFQAYQRFDYNIGLDLLSDWVLRFALLIPCVIFFRRWGIAHPEYGEAFGAAIGIGVGYYASTILTFLVGVVLYRRLGLSLIPLFLAHFDVRTVWRMLRFGLKVVAGQVFFRAATTVDRVVISLLLLNYTEWLGIQGQIHYNLMFLFPIAYRFFETAMAALSESHGNAKPTLTQYYIVRFLQVGFLYTAIGVSLLWALGPMFIHHVMDPQWARASHYIVIAALIGLFYAPAWLSDMLQKGADRPGLFAWVLGIEQVIRIALFWILIPRWQFQGFYWALLFTIMLKVVIAWVLNHLLIVRIRLFPWPMFIAPALAGLANYALLRFLGTHLPLTNRWEVIVLFFAASLASFFTCFFFYGLVGGFDRALASELESASRMTGVLRPLTRAFYHTARLGWRLSPLHHRYPVTIHAQAMEEAQGLMAVTPEKESSIHERQAITIN